MDNSQEKILYQSHQCMFKAKPVMFIILTVWSIFFAFFFIIAILSFLANNPNQAQENYSLLIAIGFTGGIPILALFFWWIRTLNTTLTITNKRTILKNGILSKHTNDVLHRDIRNIQFTQGIISRITGATSISIASAGHAGIEIEVEDMPNIKDIKTIYDDIRVHDKYEP